MTVWPQIMVGTKQVRWLDSWSGIGLLVAGMAHHVSLGEHGAGQWIAVFYHGGGGHEPVAAAGTAQEGTPWRAVQRAAWEALDKGTRDDPARVTGR